MELAVGQVAVVTGAASGVGLALARRFAADGLKAVLADVEEGALEKAAAALREDGAVVHARVGGLRALARGPTCSVRACGRPTATGRPGTPSSGPAEPRTAASASGRPRWRRGIISSDCHAGLPTEEYRPYLEARFHRDFDEFLAGHGGPPRGDDPPGHPQRVLRRQVVPRQRGGPARRRGLRAAPQGAGRRRGGGRGRLPGRGRRGQPHGRTLRSGPRPLRRPRPGPRHGGPARPQPLARGLLFPRRSSGRNRRAGRSSWWRRHGSRTAPSGT